MHRLLVYLVLLIAWWPAPVAAQPQISLEECLAWAQQHSPLATQGAVAAQLHTQRSANIRRNHWPQVDFNAQATWQSEVTALNLPDDLPFPLAVNPPPQDQYRATLELRQNLWDGGLTAAQQRLETAQYQSELQQLAVDQHQLAWQVQQYYFGVLWADAQLQLTRLLRDDLDPRIQKLSAAIEQGTALPRDLRTLEAERIRANQRLTELDASRAAALAGLALLTGRALDPATTTLVPPVSGPAVPAQLRPELGLFVAQRQYLSQQESLLSARNRPKVFAFATGGYGRPGLNLLDDQFSPYFIGGVGIKWALGDLLSGRSAGDRQLLQLQLQNVGVKEALFNQQNDAQLARLDIEIKKLQQLLAQDDALIGLREQNVATAAAQLDLGVLPATDYTNELNAAQQARENRALHQLLLVQTRWQQAWQQGQ